eukprot:2185563-Rhodomonas_salina.1
MMTSYAAVLPFRNSNPSPQITCHPTRQTTPHLSARRGAGRGGSWGGDLGARVLEADGKVLEVHLGLLDHHRVDVAQHRCPPHQPTQPPVTPSSPACCRGGSAHLT